MLEIIKSAFANMSPAEIVRECLAAVLFCVLCYFLLFAALLA